MSVLNIETALIGLNIETAFAAKCRPSGIWKTNRSLINVYSSADGTDTCLVLRSSSEGPAYWFPMLPYTVVCLYRYRPTPPSVVSPLLSTSIVAERRREALPLNYLWRPATNLVLPRHSLVRSRTSLYLYALSLFLLRKSSVANALPLFPRSRMTRARQELAEKTQEAPVS